MARTARVRALRSGANVAALTAYGTATTSPNVGTTAAFTLTIGSRRYLPNNATGTSASPPATDASRSGEGWRDDAAENAAEAVRYAPGGTWTLRTKLRKTGQTLAADVTVRLTWILYHVTSTGAHVAEVGRGESADTLLSAADLNVVTSFITNGATTLAAGDKLQVEVYVQNVDALGNSAAPATAYNVVLLLDQNEANTGTAVSAQPTYDILYARTRSETVAGVDALARVAAVRREPIQALTTTDSPLRAYVADRHRSEALVTADAMTRTTGVGRGPIETLSTQSTLERATAGSRGISESTTAADSPTRTTSVGREASQGTSVSDAVDRVYLSARAPAEVTSVVDTPRRATTVDRAPNELVLTVDALDRAIIQGRTLKEYPTGVTPDWPVDYPTRKVAGVVRDKVGNPVGGATVKLFRTQDDFMCKETTSALDGTYSFPRDLYDPYDYFVISYILGTPQTQGVSDRGLIPVDA